MSRIFAIGSNTLLELVRQKVFYFMLVFAAIAIGVAFMASSMPFAEQFQVLKDASLGAMSIFSFLLVTLATAMILPKDMEERTLYTILAKPVSRLQYLLGKLLGVYLLLIVAILMMGVFFLVALFAREQFAMGEIFRDYPPGPDRDAALAAMKAAAFNWSLVPAICVIFLKSAVCGALTLMLSTFATSWIFTIMVSVVIYIIGHIQPIARDAWLSQHGADPSPILRCFFGLVALIFPDMQLFNIVDEIIAGNAVPMWMFGQTVGLGLGYVLFYTLVGYILFSIREL